jgi:hypothetical protein
VENNGVSDCQLVGIPDNLTGIVDNWIQRQTPALVADDPLAVLTSRLRVVLVAVIRDWLVEGHEFFSSSIKRANPMALAKSNSYGTTGHWSWAASIGFNSPTRSIRIDNTPNHTIGLCAKALYKQRMISST